MSFDVGQVVGDYEVVGHIGKGGMGTVYRVRNRISDRIDALKVLLPNLESSPDLADRFLREIRVHASLRHPNIAQLYTAFRLDNRLLMVIEFVDGVSMAELLRRGPVPTGQSVAHICQALSGLAFAHQRGVVHRDVKPDNILIGADGVVKLVDFGIAHGEKQERLTLAGMVVGSLNYMSPEQVNGDAVDGRSDLYSVGVTLYQAATGRLPFQAENEYQLMRAQVNQAPPAPSELKPDLPSGLSDIILRALAKDPGHRYQTADEFRLALEPFRQEAIDLPTRTYAGLGAETEPLSSITLQTVARNLAPHVGPIARRLVQEASRKYATATDLCDSLAGHITSEADRSAFLRKCRQELGDELLTPSGSRKAKTPSPAPPPTPAAAWDPALIERAKKELASYIGPMADVIVRHAQKKARTAEELTDLLSSEIDSPPDRRRFVASLGHSK